MTAFSLTSAEARSLIPYSFTVGKSVFLFLISTNRTGEGGREPECPRTSKSWSFTTLNATESRELHEVRQAIITLN